MTAILENSACNTNSPTSSALAYFPFPRTGKRGVPQQFPRRLYEMLEGEAKLMELDPINHHRIISWSDSGKAFRIFNITEFAEIILPRYFRTKKFSSFQRNLNLYGFAKVRRGPETDMYAHPSFLRHQPESLVQLRKVTTTERKRWETATILRPNMTRSVSPTSSSSSSTPMSPPMMPQLRGHKLPETLTITISPSLPVNKTCDRGKLDLLALAMEKEFATIAATGIVPLLQA